VTSGWLPAGPNGVTDVSKVEHPIHRHLSHPEGGLYLRAPMARGEFDLPVAGTNNASFSGPRDCPLQSADTPCPGCAFLLNLEQSLQLIEHLAEEVHRVLDWFGRGHVDSGLPEDCDRVVAVNRRLIVL